jgi:fungal STAND N-terminal Goodbye domain
MSDQSESSPFQSLFDSALQDYEKQTGIGLADHPLAEQLQNCQSVESVIALLQEQARASQAFSKSQESDKIFKSLKSVVSALWSVSTTAAFGQAIGMVCPGLPTGCSTFLTTIR